MNFWMPWSPLLLAAVLYGALYWLRKPGNGGALGRAIRESDHAAWREAVADAEADLAAMRRRGLAKPFDYDYQNKCDFLHELRAAEPRR